MNKVETKEWKERKVINIGLNIKINRDNEIRRNERKNPEGIPVNEVHPRLLRQNER
jgi:hypothetical protein